MLLQLQVICKFLHQVDGEFLPDIDEKAIEKKKGDIRLIRNKYLEDYVDYYQCKPMLWNELTEDEKQSIADYRVYLKDYPNSEKMVGKQTINL